MGIVGSQNISIIIPVYNEAAAIHHLLEHLRQFTQACEIIFVDGGSQDQTVALVAPHYRIAVSPQKGRAWQMNYGARLAQGQVLLFLHADSILPADAPAQITRLVAQGHLVGCFPIKFASRHPLMKMCGWLSNLRVRLRTIAFGDQGIFMRRDYFQRLGGFPPLPLMEDYQLSMNIKADGQKIAMAAAPLLTSERRFLANGRLKTMIRMQKLQYLYRRGADIKLIARLYR